MVLPLTGPAPPLGYTSKLDLVVCVPVIWVPKEEQANWPHPLLPAAVGVLAGQCLRAPPGGEDEGERRRADQPRSTTRAELTHPSVHTIYLQLEHVKGENLQN